MASNDRQDKLLMETCIKHLIQYAATIKISRGAQGDESIGRLRKIIGEMEAYWNLSDRKGRVEQFDKTLRRAVQTGRTNGVSEEQKIAAVNGLYRYASEMISNRLSGNWQMDGAWIKNRRRIFVLSLGLW